MVDPAILKHLRAWLLKEVEDEDRRDRVETAMLAIVAEDPEYWGGKTWWAVYDQIGGHGFSGYDAQDETRGASFLSGLLGGVTCSSLGPFRWADISLCLRRTGRRRNRPVISSATQLAEFIAREIPGLAGEMKEHVLVVPVDTKNRALGIAHISTGSLDISIVHPRDVLQAVLAVPAKAFFVVHNHPSGEPVLSNEDSKLSERLDSAGKIMGVFLLDLLSIAPQEDGGWEWEATKSMEHGHVAADPDDIESWKDPAGKIFCTKCDDRHLPGQHSDFRGLSGSEKFLNPYTAGALLVGTWIGSKLVK